MIRQQEQLEWQWCHWKLEVDKQMLQSRQCCGIGQILSLVFLSPPCTRCPALFHNGPTASCTCSNFPLGAEQHLPLGDPDPSPIGLALGRKLA